jgi:RNA polymerase sigma-70 factor (ECF subfamily)
MTPPDRVSAFNVVFESHARAVLGYALRRVAQPADAADVVSETMLVAWRRLDDIPHGDEARPWLFGVARNVMINRRRTANRTARLGAKFREHLCDVVVDHADDVGTSVVVREALNAMPEEDKELLQLVAWEGLTPSEIAKVMDTPPATVRTRLHRARARLRTELGRLGWNDERIDGHVIGDERVLVRRAEEQS